MCIFCSVNSKPVSMSTKNGGFGESERMEYGSFRGMLTSSSVATPSPFATESIASTRLSTQLLLRRSNLMRFLAVLVSFLDALFLALAGNPSTFRRCSNLSGLSTYRYSLSIAIISFIYSAFQLFKGICDTAFRGLLVSETLSDYATFTLDQLVAYLLMSASSALMPSAMEIVVLPCGKLAAASAGMSLFAFLVVAISTLQSGHSLCKRIIW